jgi:branched-chain amino acid transport system substrate-binding protein
MNRKMLFVVILGVAIIGAFGLIQAQAQETIRIGALYPLTGNLATLGNVTLDGARIALEMINETGGVLGKKVEFVIGDASTPDKAVSETERLINLERLQIITGTYSSGLSYAASQVAERHGVVYLETGGIADRLTERGFKYYFRSCYTASSNGWLAADLSKDILAPKLGKTPRDLKIFVMHEDSDYVTTVGMAAVDQSKKNGFNVVGRDPYKSSSTDLSPLILRIKGLRPDIVIASSYSNDALLIQRQMKQLGVYVSAFIGTGGIYGLPSFGEGLGNAVNGILDTEGAANINISALSTNVRALAEEYRRRYTGKFKIFPSNLSTLGFTGTYLLLKNIIPAAGGTDPEKVRAAAVELDIPMKGLINGWGVKFAKPGTPMAGTNLRAFPVASQWQDNKLVVVYPTDVKMGEVKMIPLPQWDKR